MKAAPNCMHLSLYTDWDLSLLQGLVYGRSNLNGTKFKICAIALSMLAPLSVVAQESFSVPSFHRLK